VEEKEFRTFREQAMLEAKATVKVPQTPNHTVGFEWILGAERLKTGHFILSNSPMSLPYCLL
jgi:hypothetical protein